MARSEEPPRYRRAPVASKLDPFVPVLLRLLEEWPQIRAPRATELLRDEYGYDGSVAITAPGSNRNRGGMIASSGPIA